MARSTKTHTKPVSKKSSGGRYFEAVGRRKTAVARVRLFSGGSDFLINGKSLAKYFPLRKNRDLIESPFKMLAIKKFSGSARVEGGGVNAQAEAVRLGISRALILQNPESRQTLKTAGFLTRDSRKVERKKFGSRKARRPQQWRKR